MKKEKKPEVKKVQMPAKKVEIEVKKQKTFELVRGMRDILPKEENYWKNAYRTAESISTSYGFQYIETPVVENASLFVRSIGKGTDVVEKEMYMFEDSDGNKLCLRPEATASMTRAFIEHGMHVLPQPVKVWYYGPMFRHDRPQAGRYRQFHQFGCEVFGDGDPVIDAELISVAYNYLRDSGINAVVHMNSIGTLEERQRYIVELVGFLRSKRAYLCEDCKRRMNKNALRVLDCKEQSCQSVLEEAPQIIDWLEASSKNMFMKVLEYLDALEIPYVLQPKLVRGLDYYCHTVFEFYSEEGEEGSQSALGGGGRYDSLVEQLGGRPTGACGFSLGVERVILNLQKKANQNQSPVENPIRPPKIFFAQLGERARAQALATIEKLRRQGVPVEFNLTKGSLKAQLELADKCRATHTVILGQKEVQDGTAIIRDMESGIQEIIDQKKIQNELVKILKMN